MSDEEGFTARLFKNERFERNNSVNSVGCVRVLLFAYSAMV